MQIPSINNHDEIRYCFFVLLKDIFVFIVIAHTKALVKQTLANAAGFFIVVLWNMESL